MSMDSFREKTIGMWIIFLALLILTVPAVSRASSNELPLSAKETSSGADKETAYEGTIVAFGNSLSEGFRLDEEQAYPAQLERKLLANGYRYKVVNAGISGETSSGALSRVNWILNLKPDIVIVETGANDGFRGISPDLVEKNLNEITRMFKERSVTVVLAGMRMLRNLGDEYTAAFEKMYFSVAEKQQVILAPFFLQGVAGDGRLNLDDGIHPTAEGYRIVVENLYPYVVKAIEDVRAQRNR